MAKYIDNNGFAHFLGKLKTLLDGKVNTETGKGLSTNDYTTAEKNKLAGIESGAQVNTVTGIKGNSESSYRTGQVNITAANVGAAASSHTHGNIQNGGTLQTTDVAIANGDKIVITDSSDSSKIARASIAFDGSTATQALTKKGTWETFNNYSLPTAGTNTKGGVKIGAGLTMTGEVLSADVQSVPAMTGATSSAAGTAGIVPAPAAGSQGKVLAGGGWGELIAYIPSAANSPAPYTNYNRQLYIGVQDASNANYFETGIPIPNATSSEPGFMSSADKSKLDAFGAASTYALKSDITSMYKHKGSVSSTSNLPSSGQTEGDVYNVTATGMNYVWTGSEWDALGEIFTIDSMTTTEIDAAFTTAGLTAA